MTESTIQNEIRIALSPHGIIFRTNAGDFWQGQKVFSKEFNQPVLINLRRVQGLPEGFSDLLFVGDKQAAFIEIKKPGGRIRPEQINFIEQMKKLHHRAGIARSVSEALELIGVNRDG
jgi:hypothetical protein